MGSSLSRTRIGLRRQGYAPLSSGDAGGDDAPRAAQCALEARTTNLPDGPVIVMRARMLCSTTDETQGRQIPVPALLPGDVEEEIGPACVTVTTPTQDKILAELGLPSEPAWCFADE